MKLIYELDRTAGISLVAKEGWSRWRFARQLATSACCQFGIIHNQVGCHQMIAQILSTCFVKEALDGNELVGYSRVSRLHLFILAGHSEAGAATYLRIRGTQIPLQHAEIK